MRCSSALFSEYTDCANPFGFNVPSYTKTPSTGLSTCGDAEVTTPSLPTTGDGAKKPSRPTSLPAPCGPCSWNAPSERYVVGSVGRNVAWSCCTEPSGIRTVTFGAKPWLIR